MDERPLNEQIAHDLIVREAARRLGASGKYALHINPGEEHNSKLGGLFPDIIGTDKGSGRARFVVEVETQSSIDPHETPHWRDLARLGVPFYLMVPEPMLSVAQKLAERAEIECRWGTYCENERGQVRIVYKRD